MYKDVNMSTTCKVVAMSPSVSLSMDSQSPNCSPRGPRAHTMPRSHLARTLLLQWICSPRLRSQCREPSTRSPDPTPCRVRHRAGPRTLTHTFTTHPGRLRWPMATHPPPRARTCSQRRPPLWPMATQPRGIGRAALTVNTYIHMAASDAAIRVHQLRQGQARHQNPSAPSTRPGPSSPFPAQPPSRCITPQGPRSRSRSRSRLNTRSSRPTAATLQCARGTSRTVGTHC